MQGRGAVAERGVGELVGEWWAISGFPISHNVVGGVQGGSIGCVTLDRIAEVGETDAHLAIKMIKLIGIGATSTANLTTQSIHASLESRSVGQSFSIEAIPHGSAQQ